MAMSEQMSAVETCLVGFKTCLSTAMNHCLETGGKHVEREALSFDDACAEMTEPRRISS
jgi:hypothetical protein